MKQMFSQVSTISPNAIVQNTIKKAFRQITQAQRVRVVPVVGLVNNFDPDQRGFITAPMQGHVMMQVGAGAATYGALAVQADFVPPIIAQPADSEGGITNAQAAQANLDRPLPRPGYPALIYPASATGPSFNTGYAYGGKSEEQKRLYPAYLLTKGNGIHTDGDS